MSDSARPSHWTTWIGEHQRRLPIVEVKLGIWVALFNIQDDVLLAETAGKMIVKRCLPPGTERLVTVEGKATALAHVVARESGLPLLTLRKGEPKPYAQDPVICDDMTGSITSQRRQRFWCEREVLLALAGKQVSFVDDVVSTGATLSVVAEVVERLGKGRLASTVCVFEEGAAHPGVISLCGTLPLF